MSKLIIRTKNLILRPPSLRDVSRFSEILNDRRISRYLSNMPYPYTRDMAVTWIKKTQRQGRLKQQSAVYFVMEKDGQAIGSISLNKIEPQHKAFLGYWLAKDFWGQGLMSEAVKAVTDYGFRKLKLRRIAAGVFVQNPASKRVLEKNDFKVEGLRLKEQKKDGKLHDLYLLAKVR